ncbi:unnamed protein product [Durusdinium trenchii]|uniref:Receptor ligand binding region domain-containing protein n=1 Tax=Durusdinium trenchii TaxID=1381693 RepID=A0ABP0KI76_9DINO
MPIFLLVVAAATAVARGSLLCPATCTATVDGSSWPCRYYQNDCKVNITSLDPSRVVDLNVAVINPYVGGLGDLMSQVEPAIAMAVQDIEDSSFLPGYRLNAHLADSKCSVPEATRAAVAAMTTGVTKHVVLSDSCSAACEAVNDALRHFNVLQVGPGCISVSLSDSERYPYFTRMAPSFRFNVISLYDLFRYLGFHRVGTIYGYRSINNLAKDLFIEMMASDNAAGNYSWTHLYSHRVEFIEDATAAVEKAASKDSRINFVALYEAEGSMLLCQAYKKNLLTPDFNWFVAAGWWNQNYILLNANTANSPCTADELHRASYGIIASDRGPMLNTPQFHSLSGRRLDDLYSEYTNECESFANGNGVCNYQWAGYFYDGMWLIASVLHSFLINQNRSINEFGTEQSVQSLNALSEQVDFNGQTGRVRQFNAVNPKTTPPSYGDRDGIVLLRQATGPPESAFVHLAFRTEDGLDFKTSIKWSSTELTKMVACSGATCDFANGWVPSDRTDACPAGQVWSLQEGCLPCSPGHFASLGMSQCEACAPGRFSSTDGAAACSPCTPGTFAMVQRSSNCHDCPEGTYSESVEATQCRRCPIGTYAPSKGLQQCTSCPQDRETAFEGATSEDMCVCSFGQRLEGGSCILCDVTEICDGSRVIGHRPNNQQWLTTLDVAGSQRALSQMIAKEFFLIALKIEKDDQQLNSVMSLFSSRLTAMMNGDEGLNIIAAPDQAVTAALGLVMDVWVLLKPVLVDQTSKMLNAADLDITTAGQVAEQTTALRTASQGVVDALTDAASSAGAHLNGLLVDIAGRQRMLIQELCKDALIVALGASVVTTKASLQRVATLFETTHDSLIFGITAVGIPELRKVCSMHQMQEVSYYYRQVRPYLREITNGRTSVESSMIAVRVAPSINSLTTPLFQAMGAAVRLFVNDTGTCEALGTISESELMALTNGSWVESGDSQMGIRRRKHAIRNDSLQF